jgi:hypothetical protein
MRLVRTECRRCWSPSSLISFTNYSREEQTRFM